MFLCLTQDGGLCGRPPQYLTSARRRYTRTHRPEPHRREANSAPQKRTNERTVFGCVWTVFAVFGQCLLCCCCGDLLTAQLCLRRFDCVCYVWTVSPVFGFCLVFEHNTAWVCSNTSTVFETQALCLVVFGPCLVVFGYGWSVFGVCLRSKHNQTRLKHSPNTVQTHLPRSINLKAAKSQPHAPPTPRPKCTLGATSILRARTAPSSSPALLLLAGTARKAMRWEVQGGEVNISFRYF